MWSSREFMKTIRIAYLSTFCSPSADWDPDLLPADDPAEVALSGSKEQDLHRGSAAVLYGDGPAGPQHHVLAHEPGDAVQEGRNRGSHFVVPLVFSSPQLDGIGWVSGTFSDWCCFFRFATTQTCLSVRRHALLSTCPSSPTSCQSSCTVTASYTNTTGPRTSKFLV